MGLLAEEEADGGLGGLVEKWGGIGAVVVGVLGVTGGSVRAISSQFLLLLVLVLVAT